MRKLIAAGLLALTLAACTTSRGYDQTCYAPTEDSKVTCHLNPTARYDYERGWWHITNRETAPTGAEVMTFDPDR